LSRRLEFGRFCSQSNEIDGGGNAWNCAIIIIVYNID
jgi:hypothetical protein